ncbi:protein obstructor-E-like [Toxorhynchites rutilus septentrionalis]|uniref:protein obstructor-E-like n=1 Tax=Toxorhynchites rutilus septentrionalis TaxID=329112 RepID=UPI002478B56A|nr:protein obstructor-E-like [Toxorhynchites rutilus septentrionalis]
MHKSILLVAILVVCGYAANSNGYSKFVCPKDNGVFKDSYQCDKYYECKDGHASEKLCPDGLVFSTRRKSHKKCDLPSNVDCSDRKELQPPKPSGVCLRQNGFFPHPDPTNCTIFYSCVEGRETEMTCAAGLHFDSATGTCNWAETAGRTNCRSNANKKLKDGFQCPADFKQINSNGQMVTHPNFPHPEDCTKFYICLNGVEPRQGACHAGMVYNKNTQRCEEPESVPGCENWYKHTVKSKH